MHIRSAGEAIFLACEMEKQAIRLYERALILFQDTPSSQAICQILAEERIHLAHFERLGKECCSLEQAELLSAQAAKTLFSGGLMAAQRKGAFASPLSLYCYAAKEEENAIRTYTSFANALSDEAAQAFLTIANEEKRHLEEFQGFAKALGNEEKE